MAHRLRVVVDAIRYLVRYGVEWRALPADFPPWQAVYAFFERWAARLFSGVGWGRSEP